MAHVENDISIHGLRIAYREREVLNIPDLNLESGKIYALIGPNGSGKTSLLNALSGKDHFQGKIEIQSLDLNKISRKELAQKISFTPSQNPTSAIKVDEFLALNRFAHTNFLGKLSKADHAKISEAIRITSVEKLVKKNFNELSDGEKKKVMIAASLVQDCPIMLMDEPTNFLDIGNKYQFAQLLKRIQFDLNKTVLISTHDLELAFSVAHEFLLILNQEVVKMEAEQVKSSKALEEVFKDYNIQTDEEGNFKFS